MKTLGFELSFPQPSLYEAYVLSVRRRATTPNAIARSPDRAAVIPREPIYISPS
jgi:hypothetical protein